MKDRAFSFAQKEALTMPEIILSDYFCSDESEEFVYFKVPRRHEQYKFPLCFTKGHFSKTAELWHFLRKH